MTKHKNYNICLLFIALLLLAILYPLSKLIIFQQNDDYLYYKSVSSFLQGNFISDQRIGATFYTQAFLGTVFAIIFGISKLEDHTNTFYQIYHQKPVYFVRTDGHLEVDINDLNAQLARSESNIPLIFRGDSQRIYFDHKINELGIDLQNPVAEEKSITKHLERVKRNVDIIKSAGLNEVFHYNETYLFEK